MSYRTATQSDTGSNLPKCPDWCTLGEHPFEVAENGYPTRVHQRVEFASDPTLMVFEATEIVFAVGPLRGPVLGNMRALYRGRELGPGELKKFVDDIIAACEQISGEKFTHGASRSEA